MKERPILFSSSMVRAILNGRKSVTRRVVKPQPLRVEWDEDVIINGEHPSPWFVFDWSTAVRINYARQGEIGTTSQRRQTEQYLRTAQPTGARWSRSETLSLCPYGKVGDRLWVRETFAYTTDYDGNFLLDGVKALYRADDGTSMVTPSRWRPSIFMPRSLSRITLTVTKIRVERVQDISEQDAMAEGAEPLNGELGGVLYKPAFSALWDSINKMRGFGWDENPWVYVVRFERAEENK